MVVQCVAVLIYCMIIRYLILYVYLIFELVPFSVRSKVEHPKVNSRYISVRLCTEYFSRIYPKLKTL